MQNNQPQQFWPTAQPNGNAAMPVGNQMNGQLQPAMQQPVPNWNRPVFTGANSGGPVNYIQPTPSNMGYNPQPVPSLSGRMVTNPQEIRPNEVPMDGSVSFFPSSDGSYIYAKFWGPDGNIQTRVFVPEQPISAEEPQGPSEFNQVMARLDKIEQMLANRGQNRQFYNNRNSQTQSNTNGVKNENSKTEAMNNG